MNNPLISVIIPIYNVEKYLRECVDSVLAQTYRNIEVILVDDGSPDGCPAICDDYANKDDRVRVIHKQNGGISDARNYGIDIMTGDYVIFLDSDDYWLSESFLDNIVSHTILNHVPDCILIRALSVSETGVYGSSDASLSDFFTDILPRQRVIEYLNSIGALKGSACTLLVRSDIVRNHSISFEKGLLSEDIDYVLQLYPHIETFGYYDEPIYAYRKREGSITHSIGTRAFDSLLWIIDKWKNLIPTLSISDPEKEIFMSFLAYQYSILMAFLPKLSGPDKTKYKNELKKRKHILSYTANPKVKKTAKLYKIAGFGLTSRILNFYLKIR